MSPVATPTNPQQVEHNGIFHVIKKDFFSIPVSVRIISVSLFLFVLGRGLGADTFFSIFVQTIVDNVFWVSVIGALLAVGKLFFTLPIGAVDDHSDMKSIIFLSKIFYMFAGFLYFFAGIFVSIPLLIIAVIINGFASATLMTTYQTFVRKYSKKQNRCAVFGLYFSSLNVAFIIGALISSVLIKHIQLPYLFLFIVLFSLISLITDNKLPRFNKKKIKALFGSETFLHQFFREVFSISLLKNTVVKLRSYPKKLIHVLYFEFLFNFLNYIGFLFIPIVAVANNLNLSEIAILFAVMRLPYVLSFLTAEFADRYDKKTLMLVILLFLSFLFALLGYNEDFGAILTISFGISLGLSLIRPILSGMISDHTPPKEDGGVTGAGEFIGRMGEIVGALLFGVLSVVVGLNFSFTLIGIGIFVLSFYLLAKKFLKISR